MADLERVLAKLVKEQARKPLTRRFIVTEGLFENVGDVVNLPKLIELKHKYKFRVILDETWSYGVLGRTGRGVTEQQNVDAREIDMIIGSLAGALCAGGGFCAGTVEIVEHQRLSANAYTFSAALPAMLATTASETVRMLQEQPEMILNLRENIRTMRAQLDPRSDWVVCSSAIDNPVMLLVFKKEVVETRRLGVPEQEALIQDAVDEVCFFVSATLYRTTSNFAIVSREWRANHPPQEHAASSWCSPQRSWLATTASTQGMRHDRSVKEGNRKGWYCHQTRDNKGHDSQEVRRCKSVNGRLDRDVLDLYHTLGEKTPRIHTQMLKACIFNNINPPPAVAIRKRRFPVSSVLCLCVECLRCNDITCPGCKFGCRPSASSHMDLKSTQQCNRSIS